METIKVKNKQFIRLVFKLLFSKNVLVELLEKTPRDKNVKFVANVITRSMDGCVK